MASSHLRFSERELLNEARNMADADLYPPHEADFAGRVVEFIERVDRQRAPVPALSTGIEIRVRWRAAGSGEKFITAAKPESAAQAAEWAADWRQNGCEVHVEHRTITTTPWVALADGPDAPTTRAEEPRV